jgi:hypothetical protein
MRRSRPRVVLDPDLAAALHCLVAAFGIAQITVTGVQAVGRLRPDLHYRPSAGEPA